MQYLNEIIDSNFIEFANYVVKDRAIPHINDGLKPVQRRILHSMWEIDDGRFNKVANIVGHTMKYHPHGDASIADALVNMANKELFIDKQGNFGNIFTGDSAAAARYIEARLTPLAKEVLFNKDITDYTDSYDGRNKEPITFPAKIPVLLLTGVDGIAVGMSTKILPHNFKELLEAQIAYLEKKTFKLYPDFMQGGIIDCSEYNDGNGKIKVRAVLEIASDKKILIKELPYGTTTESLINSIEKQAKRGKLKITSINDYTTSDVEIEINLSRGYSAQEAEAALYAFTDCEISISPQLLCINEELPKIMSVTEVIGYYSDKLVENLKRELEILLNNLLDKWHYKSLAQIFVEQRIYNKIEELKDYNLILSTVQKSFDPYREKLLRDVTIEDAERLLQLQIKRISRFDIDKNRKELKEIKEEIKSVRKNLKRIVSFTIDYLGDLLNKYGKKFIRKSKIDNLEVISAKEAAIENMKFSYDRSTGYIGTSVKGDSSIMVSEFSHILLIFRNGTYKVIKVEDKVFIGKKLVYFSKVDGKEASERIFSVIFREKKNKLCFLKRFSSIKYILDKEYRYYPENCKLEYFTTRRNLHFTCYLERLPRMRTFYHLFELESYRVKGVSAGGNKICNKNIIKIKAKKSELYTENDNEDQLSGTEVIRRIKKPEPTFENQEKAETIIPEEPSLFDPEDDNNFPTE